MDERSDILFAEQNLQFLIFKNQFGQCQYFNNVKMLKKKKGENANVRKKRLVGHKELIQT